MIKKKVTTKVVTEIKGTLVGVDSDGLHIEDAKTGVVEIVNYDLFREFSGDEILINVSKTTKEEAILSGAEADEECCDCGCSDGDCVCIDGCKCKRCGDVF